MRNDTVVPSPHGHHSPNGPGASSPPPQNTSWVARSPPHFSTSARTPSGAPGSVSTENDVGSASAIAARASASRARGTDDATHFRRRSYIQSGAGQLLRSRSSAPKIDSQTSLGFAIASKRIRSHAFRKVVG